MLDRENRSGAEKVMKWRQALKIVARARAEARRLAPAGVALPEARWNTSLAQGARPA